MTASSSTALIACPALSGHRWVTGLWFPADWSDEYTRRSLLIKHWRLGASARRFAQGDLLRFPSPEFLDCDQQSGWPLEACEAGMSSAALSKHEAKQAASADLLIVRSGQWLPLNLRDSQPLDPADWLDIDGLACHDTLDWSATAPQPEAIQHVVRPIRDVLNGKIGEVSPEQEKFLRALKGRQPTNELSPGSKPGAAPTLPSSSRHVPISWRVGGPFKLAVVLASALVLLIALSEVDGGPVNVMAPLTWLLLGLVLRAVWRVIRGKPAWRDRPTVAHRPTQGQAGSGNNRKATPSTIPPRGKPAQTSRWRDLATRVAMLTQLSRLIGLQQARYLQRMLGMFESGKLEEALRHAVPLGGQDAPMPPALGTPQARQALDLRTPAGASSTIGVGHDMEAHLRQIYRKTFEQLKRQKRVDEAVFVLAVLLNARQEALDYLEAEGRFAQAAELALAWDQPADVLVRLHCLAGDWRKALAIARRDQAFASAVRQLESKWPDAARQLRSEWGDALAQQGRWAAAIDAVWPAPELRDKAAQWLQSAERSGGVLGAKALVQRAALLPDTLMQHEALLHALRDEPGHHVERAAVAEALQAVQHKGQGTRMMASCILPMLIQDVVSAVTPLPGKALQSLVELTGDRFLQVDLPHLSWPGSTPSDLKHRDQPLIDHAPHPGTAPICDAMALDGGRALLALGEAGVMLIDAMGRKLHHFKVPGHGLVAGHSGHNALAISKRESLLRVSRLDLVHRESLDLGMLRADCFADTFDGIAWTISRGNELFVLDTARSVQDVLWHIDGMPGPVISMATNAQCEALMVSTGEHANASRTVLGVELWRYQLPGRRLSGRDPLLYREGNGKKLVHPHHGLLEFDVKTSPNHGAICEWGADRGRRVLFQFGLDYVDIRQVWCGDTWLLLEGLSDKEICLVLVEIGTGEQGATIHWPVDARVKVRWYGEHCLIFDDQGRMLRLDSGRGQVGKVSLR